MSSTLKRITVLLCSTFLALCITMSTSPKPAEASGMISPLAMYEEVLDYYKNFYGPRIKHERYEVAYKRLAFKTSYRQTHISVTSEWGEYLGWLGHERGNIYTYKAHYEVW